MTRYSILTLALVSTAAFAQGAAPTAAQFQQALAEACPAPRQQTRNIRCTVEDQGSVQYRCTYEAQGADQRLDPICRTRTTGGPLGAVGLDRGGFHDHRSRRPLAAARRRSRPMVASSAAKVPRDCSMR